MVVAGVTFFSRTGKGGLMSQEWFIAEGMVPGLIGRVTSLESAYYKEHWQLGKHFESVIFKGLSDFFDRYVAGLDAFFRVAIPNGMTPSSDLIMGSMAVDCTGRQCSGEVALRWFFLHPSLHGLGVGKALMGMGIAFAEGIGASEIVVETFEGLDAACGIYEASGFYLEERWEGHQWGRPLPERRYRRLCDAGLVQDSGSV